MSAAHAKHGAPNRRAGAALVSPGCGIYYDPGVKESPHWREDRLHKAFKIHPWEAIKIKKEFAQSEEILKKKFKKFLEESEKDFAKNSAKIAFYFSTQNFRVAFAANAFVEALGKKLPNLPAAGSWCLVERSFCPGKKA